MKQIESFVLDQKYQGRSVATRRKACESRARIRNRHRCHPDWLGRWMPVGDTTQREWPIGQTARASSSGFADLVCKRDCHHPHTLVVDEYFSTDVYVFSTRFPVVDMVRRSNRCRSGNHFPDSGAPGRLASVVCCRHDRTDHRCTAIGSFRIIG